MRLSGGEPQGNPTEYEDRWERAASVRNVARRELLGEVSISIVKNLEGDWKVERLSGPVPMPFVWKRIRGGRGETHVLPRSWQAIGAPLEPKFPFELKQREGHVSLIYRPPLSFMVDDLRLEANGSWLGQATAAGIRYAWFQMVPVRDLKG
jgi:hypothetical protein